ncbi:MAG: guanylate kinase [Candidatus Lernaella stagnicola]|nr:guanylate kinase [Candidatus Lernaella stagnicola]
MSSEKRQGNLIVVVAPSGGGKTTLCHAVIDRLPGIRFSVSHTTRPARGDEVDGVAYHFVDRDEFQRMIDREALVEWAQIHGHYYGTSHTEIENARRNGEDIFLDIEGQGAMQIRARYPDAVLVYILPPSMEVLRERLRARGTDSEDEVERRCENARREIEFIHDFDYVIINDELEAAVTTLEAIVRAGRQRRENMRDAIARYLTTP